MRFSNQQVEIKYITLSYPEKSHINTQIHSHISNITKPHKNIQFCKTQFIIKSKQSLTKFNGPQCCIPMQTFTLKIAVNKQETKQIEALKTKLLEKKVSWYIFFNGISTFVDYLMLTLSL